MTAFRTLTPRVLVTGQISPADLTEAAALGVTRVVNNRPDHEEPGQITSAEIETAARALGLDYVHAPARGMPGEDVVTAVEQALDDDATLLMFCRSGMRSTVAWALASNRKGDVSADDIRAAGAAAGYDLSSLPL